MTEYGFGVVIGIFWAGALVYLLVRWARTKPREAGLRRDLLAAPIATLCLLAGTLALLWFFAWVISGGVVKGSALLLLAAGALIAIGAALNARRERKNRSR